jgi:geranylgeranyl reductase family protein
LAVPAPTSTVDVVVVGGGPAGSAAAITLAQAGREVVVVDRARFPRDKCCGDGLTAGALRILEVLGLEPHGLSSWQVVDDVVVRSPSGREVTFPLPRGAGQYAAVVRRIELDAALLDLARSSGAVVFDGHACTAGVAARDHITVTVDGVGEIAARYAIGADGMWSPLRKHLDTAEPSYRGEWHAFRQYFTNVGPRAATELFVWFEPEVLPGYAWSFPLPGATANVGFGIVRGDQLDGAAMKQLWPKLLGRPHIRAVLGDDAVPEAPHRAWPIPAGVDDVSLTVGRALFVGDAARTTDPMTGEGIAQALLSGMLAAKALMATGPFDAIGAARQYREAVARELFADHRASLVLGRGVRHRKGARTAVRVAGFNAWTRRNFGRWLFEDYPRAILATPRRWHRGMLKGPGAYRANGTADASLLEQPHSTEL